MLIRKRNTNYYSKWNTNYIMTSPGGFGRVRDDVSEMTLEVSLQAMGKVLVSGWDHWEKVTKNDCGGGGGIVTKCV